VPRALPGIEEPVNAERAECAEAEGMGRRWGVGRNRSTSPGVDSTTEVTEVTERKRREEELREEWTALGDRAKQK